MAKNKQKFSRDARKPSKPSAFKCPAISVIIPMYNVEKYIGETLDSLLAQTFTDFEVIVVDDCSTDKSATVVENYAERFDGRLKLTSLKKHSGGATEPRNLGLAYSHGEYVYFMDSDDTVTPTALEILYTHAKKFDADVVQCEKNYEIPDEHWGDADYIKNLKPSCWPANEKVFITQPTLLTEDFARRAVEFSRSWLTWSIWIQLIRRDFLIKNNLHFVGIALEDLIFTMCEICSAKRYLVVPNVIYTHRTREGSLLWRDKENIEKFVHSRLISVKEGVRYLDEYLNGFETFAHRPDLKYALFNMFIQEILGHLMEVYAKVPAPQLDALLRKEFVGENSALTSFMFNTMNVQRLQLIMAQRRIAELEAALKAKH